MVDINALGKSLLSAHIRRGGVAVDFTMGNGNDTRWLSDAVGPTGHVYSFDIQPLALERTRALLESSGCANNYTLILDSHENVLDYVSAPICAGVFNLGYLPGRQENNNHASLNACRSDRGYRAARPRRDRAYLRLSRPCRGRG